MTISEILGLVITIAAPILVALIGFVVYFLCKKLSAQTDNEFVNGVLSEISKRVRDAVRYVNQTYVDALKKEGKFDLEAQKKAFQTAYNTIIETLSADALAYIESISGETNKLLEVLIENEVWFNKA